MEVQSSQDKSLINTIIGTILVFLFVLLMWENDARQYGSNCKPSVMIDFVGSKSKALFYFIGKCWAKISSYLTWINLTEIKITIVDLVKSVCKLLESPIEAFKGYYETACTYEFGPWQIYIGSFLLVLAVFFMDYNYGFSKTYLGFDFYWAYELFLSELRQIRFGTK